MKPYLQLLSGLSESSSAPNEMEMTGCDIRGAGFSIRDSQIIKHLS